LNYELFGGILAPIKQAPLDNPWAGMSEFIEFLDLIIKEFKQMGKERKM